jgi:hypothetical protein
MKELFKRILIVKNQIIQERSLLLKSLNKIQAQIFMRDLWFSNQFAGYCTFAI